MLHDASPKLGKKHKQNFANLMKFGDVSIECWFFLTSDLRSLGVGKRAEPCITVDLGIPNHWHPNQHIKIYCIKYLLWDETVLV